MAESGEWSDKFYLKELLQLLRNTFSRLFPRINEKLSVSEPPSIQQSVTTPQQTVVTSQTESQGNGFLRSWFSLMGVSVFIVSSPIICAFVWRQFWGSRLFERKGEELAEGGIVITGCDSGIGIETAALLSAAYPSTLVFAGCLTEGGMHKLASLRRDNLNPFHVDVTSDADVCDFVNFVRSRLGNAKLLALVNNAGVFDGSFVEVTPLESYQRVLQVNLFGVIRATKAFLPLLTRDPTHGGRIINISSLAEMLCSPGNTAYSASKYALAAFTDGLRQEFRELGIKVIRIVPGPVRTGSLKQIPVSANALLTSGPQEVLERFGGQQFLMAYGRFFSDLYQSASPPVKIAKAIQKAVVRKYPKDIYYEDEQIYNILTLCPHFVRDFLMDLRSFRRQIATRYKKH